MSWEPLVLYALGFAFLMGKRSFVAILCGLQICAISLLAFCARGGSDAAMICLVVLICSGLVGVVGISVLSRRELQREGQVEE